MYLSPLMCGSFVIKEKKSDKLLCDFFTRGDLLLVLWLQLKTDSPKSGQLVMRQLYYWKTGGCSVLVDLGVPWIFSSWLCCNIKPYLDQKSLREVRETFRVKTKMTAGIKRKFSQYVQKY